MSDNEEIVGKVLEEFECEGTTYFSNDEFIDAIIGLSEDNRVVYDYDKMVEWFMKENDCDADEAIDYIEYNTIRSLPYYPNSPIIVRSEFAEVINEYKNEKNERTSIIL